MTTLINIVLDKSGSMSSVRDATISGFNEFMAQQPSDAEVNVMLFDTETRMLHENVPVALVPALTAEQYAPGGMTALYDAVGQSIRAIERRVDQPERVAFVILTDGEENSSLEYVQRQIFDLITWHQNEGKGWDFTFLGANMDSYAVGGSLGVSAVATMDYAASPDGTSAAFAAAAASTSSYVRGESDSLGYDDETREKVESTQ